MTLENKRLLGIMIGVGSLLLVPIIAMQFTDEVNWTLSDFIVAGVLLVSTGLVCELTIRKVRQKKSRIIVLMVVIAVLVLTWMELAVGVFGTPFAGS